MKIDAFKAVLKAALLKNWNILVQSAPGIGKSEAVVETAKELGMDIMVMHPVTQSPDDVKGLGFINNGKADFFPYAEMERMLTATRPLVVFVDDIGQAVQSMQGAWMQLLQARELNGKKISPFVRFVAATNRASDGAGASAIITALISRFRVVITLEACASAWVKWGLVNGMPAELCAYLKFKPEMISTFNPKNRGAQFACPRTIFSLGEWINANEMSYEVWEGAVGETFATEFKGFYDIYKSVATLPAVVIMNPEKADIPADVSTLFALVACLVNMTEAKNIDQIAKYICRLDGEYRTFYFRSVEARKTALCNSAAFVNWMLNYPKDIA